MDREEFFFGFLPFLPASVGADLALYYPREYELDREGG